MQSPYCRINNAKVGICPGAKQSRILVSSLQLPPLAHESATMSTFEDNVGHYSRNVRYHDGGGGGMPGPRKPSPFDIYFHC